MSREPDESKIGKVVGLMAALEASAAYARSLRRFNADWKASEWWCDSHRLRTNSNPCCLSARVVAWVKPADSKEVKGTP